MNFISTYPSCVLSTFNCGIDTHSGFALKMATTSKEGSRDANYLMGGGNKGCMLPPALKTVGFCYRMP